MQTQLQQTALALRTDPSTVIRPFQEILSRSSYFQAMPGSQNWIVLLGAGPQRAVPQALAATIVLPDVALPRIFEYVVPQPALATRALRFSINAVRITRQWLMHPVIDTREPS